MNRSREAFDKQKRLLKIPFSLAEDDLDLSEETKRIVREYGVWLQALENGEIAPCTTDQKKFIHGTYDSNMDPLYKKVVSCWFEYQKAMKVKFENKQSSGVGYNLGVYNEWQRRFDLGQLPSIAKSDAPSHEQLESSSQTCPRCMGDGGAGGRCPICHGNGIVKMSQG